MKTSPRFSYSSPSDSHDINSAFNSPLDIKRRAIEEKEEDFNLESQSQPRSNMIATRLLLLSTALISTILLISAHQALGGITNHPNRLAAVSSKAVSNSTSSRDFKPVTAPSAFPTTAFSSYYQQPTGTLDEPRPVITDVVRNSVYPDSLDNPTMLPTGAPTADAVLPKPSSHPKIKDSDADTFATSIQSNITQILNSTTLTKCDKCLQSLSQGQKLARAFPSKSSQVMISLCKAFKYKSDSVCESNYSPAQLAGQYSQVLSYSDFSEGSTDGEYICSYVFSNSCPLPSPIELSKSYLDKWFNYRTSPPKDLVEKFNKGQSQKAGPQKVDSKGNKKMLKVLHASDIHVDPRFYIGSEAACTNGQCCRADSFNSTLASASAPLGSRLPKENISDPAGYWGNYKCDAPWPLALAALESVTEINGGEEVDFTVYTGDMVTHDATNHLSRDLVTYTQQSIFDSMKNFLGSGPVFSAIGNHDSSPSDSASPRDLPDGRGEQFSWDWENLQRLFQSEGWFEHSEAEQVGKHYGGYSVSPRKGLRIITINTDFWYKGNVFNSIHSSDPDYSGTLRFLTDELQKAEDRRERVWIVGHVLTGWDGSNPTNNPTNLFYQIVSRFAPHTIAHMFFGHTHEDQFNVFYSKNGTTLATKDAVSSSFIGPSVTPGSNVNPSLRIYEVDPETYEVMDYHQWYTQLSTFSTLPQTSHGPVWEHLYTARSAYSNFTSSFKSGAYSAPVTLTSAVDAQTGVETHSWPSAAPLNGSFFAALTDEMENRPELVQTFTVYQGRNSSRSPACTTEECVKAKVCYMRSGSALLGKQCPTGYASVQS